jgi:hypothetical protein
MSMLDSLLNQTGMDLNGLAGRAGLTPEQLRQGAEAMLGRIVGQGQAPDAAAAGAATETGLSAEQLQALAPMLSEMIGRVGLQNLLNDPASVITALDRDGDGAVLDDLGDMARGLFGGGR